jgi:hypothetical protein
MARLLGAAIIFLLAQTAAQGKDYCHLQQVPPGLTGTVDVTIRAIPNSLCWYKFRVRDQDYLIVEPPTHGEAFIFAHPGSTPHRVYYRTNADYLGPDTFTLERKTMTALHQPSVRRVRVHVTVTPSL